MSVHQYDISAIETRTGLSRAFINKCNRRLATTLSRFRIKGDKNKLLYDDDGLRMWDVIKQEKEKGSSVPQIQKALEQIIQPTEQPEQSSIQTTTTEADNQQNGEGRGASVDLTGLLVSTLKDSHLRELETKDQMIGILSGNLKLLEEGRERRENREANLMEQVKTLSTKVTTEEERGRQREERRRQRKALYSKLATLNGWGKGKEREAVLKEIEVLDAL